MIPMCRYASQATQKNILMKTYVDILPLKYGVNSTLCHSFAMGPFCVMQLKWFTLLSAECCVSHLDVHILDNKTKTVKTKNSNAMVNFLPSFSMVKTVTNNPEITH